MPEEDLVEVKFRLYDGSDVGPFRYSPTSTTYNYAQGENNFRLAQRQKNCTQSTLVKAKTEKKVDEPPGKNFCSCSIL
ncbi:hypothetical protein SLA2020_022260 [Shorea laevis]